MPELAPPAIETEAATPGLLARDRKIAVLLGAGILLLLFAVGAAALTMLRIAEDTEMVEHTLVVQAGINRTAALNERVETGRRGYIIEPSPDFRGTVQQATSDLRSEISNLRRLVADNPVQAGRAAEIAGLISEREALIQRLLTTGERSASPTFNEERGVVIVRRIRVLSSQMIEAEAALLRERNQSQLSSLILLYIVGGAALALLLGVLGAVIYTILRYNRDLTATQNLLQRANEGLEAAVTKRTAELQRANQEIQRFAYIVSHDLRSPLVNVLGFTSELDEARKSIGAYLSGLFERHPNLRDESVWLAVDEDLPEAIGFIRTSTEKMDRLINSILQLSRQGRRPLVPETLDMDEVAAGIVATLHQRTQEAGATIEVQPLPKIENDRIAIEQILSNLVENAIKYLKPGRPGEIRIEGRRAGRFVEIDVIDNGRGIAPADHERIFELFRRSGAQDQPGEGIGLAHVRALGYRLGGLVEVESELDQGARFRLSVPAKFTVTEQPNE